jgi:hypothetical protein
MTKSTPPPKGPKSSRKPRRRILLNDPIDAPVIPAAREFDAGGAEGSSQSPSSGHGGNPSTAIDQDDDALEVGLPDDHPAVRAFYDEEHEDERVGYKKPPKKHQFTKGQSGNPSGTRKPQVMQPGAINSLIGKTILEEISGSLSSPVRSLEVLEDDNAATALAKRIVADGLRKEGRSRALLIDYYVEPERNADRYKQLDHSAATARMLGEMAQALIDPTMNDEDITDMMNRLSRIKEETATLEIGPLDELPPLPKPKKASKTGKTSRRAKPATPKPSGEKNCPA